MHKSPRLIPYIFRPRLPLLCSHSQLQNNTASFPPSTAKALYPPIGDGPTPLLASTAGMRGQRGEESSVSYLHSTAQAAGEELSIFQAPPGSAACTTSSIVQGYTTQTRFVDHLSPQLPCQTCTRRDKTEQLLTSELTNRFMALLRSPIYG